MVRVVRILVRRRLGSADVAYETRDPGAEKVNYAKRFSYLIDRDGVIAKSYQVGDVNAHCERCNGSLDPANAAI